MHSSVYVTVERPSVRLFLRLSVPQIGNSNGSGEFAAERPANAASVTLTADAILRPSPAR